MNSFQGHLYQELLFELSHHQILFVDLGVLVKITFGMKGYKLRGSYKTRLTLNY